MELLPVNVPAFWPTSVICGESGSAHATVPDTLPLISTTRIPAGTVEAGRAPVDATTRVSPVEAQRPSW